MKIILASQSPRRKELLKKINLYFNVINPDINEKSLNPQNHQPHRFCMYLAKKKCEVVANKFKNSLVIGADTIVYHNNKILGKPRNKSEAVLHLNALSGDTHKVYTGVSIIHKNKNINTLFYEKTFVTFNTLDKNDIEFYVTHHNPYDKAGSYGIQDWSIIFAQKINGCFNNVVGFPISKFYKLSMDNIAIKQILKANQINV